MSIRRQLESLSQGVVVVDGGKFKAADNRDRNFTPHKPAKRMRRVEEGIARYMDALDTADRTQPVDLQAKAARLQDKSVELRKQMQHLREIEIELAEQPDRQSSQTDPDARSMATSGRGTGMVGYNAQVAADAEHHLIVATEVIDEGHDRGSLWSMAQRSREAAGKDKIELIADRGYFKGPEIAGLRASGHQDPRARADDVQLEGRRPVQQSGLHLHGPRRRVPMPGRSAATRAPLEPRERPAHRHLLHIGVPTVPDQGAMHAPARNAASDAGSTKRCWTSCRPVWIASPTR